MNEGPIYNYNVEQSVSLNDIYDLIRTVITYEIPTELAFKTKRRITKS